MYVVEIYFAPGPAKLGFDRSIERTSSGCLLFSVWPWLLSYPADHSPLLVAAHCPRRTASAPA